MSWPRWPWRLGSLHEAREGGGDRPGLQQMHSGRPQNPTRPLAEPELVLFSFLPLRSWGLPGGRTQPTHFWVPVLPSTGPVWWARHIRKH